MVEKSGQQGGNGRKTCSIADAAMTRDWQQRLAAIARYKGPVDGKCDRELIEIFAACARDRCQF